MIKTETKLIWKYRITKNTISVKSEKNYPVYLVLKHIQRNGINIYEMIRGEKKLEETKSLNVFPIKFTKYIRNYLLK